jgi:hypothetical protein
MTTGANVETIQTVMTAADAPGDITAPEAGSKLTVLNIQGEASSPVTGGLYEMLIYLDRSGLTIPSTTPIADFWATTEPPTRNSLDIRRMTLRYMRMNVATSNTTGLRFRTKIRFPRGVALLDGDRIRLVIRANVSSTALITYAWTAVTRK